MLRGKYRIPFYMSTDCENLLKKFLILNPSKRGSLEVRLLRALSNDLASPPSPPSSTCFFTQQQIMRDRWMNVGYEEEELKPYIEPQPDYKDPRKTGRTLVGFRVLQSANTWQCSGNGIALKRERGPKERDPLTL